jgi:transposase
VAPGAALSWSDHPDGVESVVPIACDGCGEGLEHAEQVGVVAQQVIEIPLVTAKRIEYQLHKRRCGCGHVTRAALPAGVADVAVSYGPNLQAFAVYLLVAHAIPVERCQMLIADVTGAKPSAGFVNGMLERQVVACRPECLRHHVGQPVTGMWVASIL